MTVRREAMSEATLQRLLEIAEDHSPLIVEHRIYRGAQAPHRFVTASADQLRSYLREHHRPGDSYWFWRFDECCPDDRAVCNLVVPDADGNLPSGGAY